MESPSKWCCDGRGRELLIMWDMATGECGPIADRKCAGCPDCQQRNATNADEASVA